MSTEPPPVLPDYRGACIANLVPELIKQVMGLGCAAWLPAPVRSAKQVVVLVVDGLGWHQLQARVSLAPTLAGLAGGAITSVAPTTTAAALTSITTGRPPSVHGVVGYQLPLGDDLLNVLKWTTGAGDARELVVPEEFQTQPAFAANPVPVVTRAHFEGSGFTRAHLPEARIVGYTAPSSIAVDVWRLAKDGEPLVYAYYDGLDAVAHAHGLDEHYDAELYTIERMVRDIVAGLPQGCALVVTADHGHVEVGGQHVNFDPEVVERCRRVTGEARFRWLHAKDGDREGLAQLCRERFEGLAWVRTVDEVSDAGWFGGPLQEWVRARVGDVAVAASARVAFRNPFSDRESTLRSRHGSLTADEMMVPLLTTCA